MLFRSLLGGYSGFARHLAPARYRRRNSPGGLGVTAGLWEILNYADEPDFSGPGSSPEQAPHTAAGRKPTGSSGAAPPAAIPGSRACRRQICRTRRENPAQCSWAQAKVGKGKKPLPRRVNLPLCCAWSGQLSFADASLEISKSILAPITLAASVAALSRLSGSAEFHRCRAFSQPSRCPAGAAGDNARASG